MQTNEVTSILGITRDRIKYYRKQGVFIGENSAIGNRGPEYTTEDLKKLKALVILTKSGFSCGDIRRLQNEQLPFHDAITEKKDIIQSEMRRLQGSLHLLEELDKGDNDYNSLDVDYLWNVIIEKETEGLSFSDLDSMYPVEQAESMTGLKPFHMKLYVEDGLIHPVKMAREHLRKKCFSQNELEQMHAIFSLRRYFGVEEIRRLQVHPEQTNQILMELSEERGIALYNKEEILNPVKRLQRLTEDAEELNIAQKQTDRRDLSSAAKVAVFLALLMIAEWEIVMAAILEPSIFRNILLFVLVIFSGISAFMALRYGTAVKRAMRTKYQGMGTVLQVKKGTGFSSSFSRAGNNQSSFSEQGRGGIWVIFFLLWNEIRPDHWYPVIQFEDENGIQAIATFCYGGLKGNWYEGEVLSVAWNNYIRSGLLPLEGQWVKRKAIAYGFLSIVLWAVSCCIWFVL